MAANTLVQAISQLNWGQCMRCIREGNGLLHILPDNHTMLHLLVANEAPISVLRAAILTGVINLTEQTHEFGLTVLHRAIQLETRCRLDILELLVTASRGLLLHIPSRHGSTPLFLACQLKCDANIIHYLILAGSNVNAQNENGATPLSVCAEVNASPEIVRILVAAGADINKPKFHDFITPLYVACDVRASLELIRTMCECGASCTSTAMEGSTPLHIAAQRNISPSVMQVLIEHGGNVNQGKNDGGTPIYIAAQQNVSCALMRVMIEIGAGNVCQPRNDGNTPILSACQNNCCPDLVQVLIQAGADLNQTQREGMSCLLLATAYVASPKLVGWLLFRGADPSIRDATGRLAIQYCRDNFDFDSARLIEKRNLFMTLLTAAQHKKKSPAAAAQQQVGKTASYAHLLPIELLRRNLCEMLFSV